MADDRPDVIARGRPTAVEPAAMPQRDCPRCGTSMNPTELGHLCPDCEGCWLDFGEFSEVLHLPEQQLQTSELAPTLEADRNGVSLDRYLRCPSCSVRMRRHIYMMDSGVVVDECREHGIWLDDGELGKIRDYLHRDEPGGSEPEQATFFRRLLSR